jgi:hypothetical protein
MKFKPYQTEVNYELNRTILTFELPRTYNKDIETLFKKPSKNGYELKVVSEKRSLNANNYCWVLCDQIAQVIHSTKEDVYRLAITEVGRFIEMSFTSQKDMDDFVRWWQEKGIGWIVEMVDTELMIVHAYIGSSRYTTQEMNVLIDNIVESARELGISTKSDEEIDSLVRSWGYE